MSESESFILQSDSELTTCLRPPHTSRLDIPAKTGGGAEELADRAPRRRRAALKEGELGLKAEAEAGPSTKTTHTAVILLLQRLQVTAVILLLHVYKVPHARSDTQMERKVYQKGSFQKFVQ